MVGIDKTAFRKKVERLSNLPTLPGLMERFAEMIQDPATSMAKIGEELGKDQILTSKLLKLVNSAFYGFPGRISTLSHALVLLGYDAVKGLIVTSNVFDELNPTAYPLWRHSIATSRAARTICDVLKIPDQEEITIATLLHDIGKIVLHIEVPDEYLETIDYAVSKEIPMWKAERQRLGFDHADIGLWLCDKWHLPAKLSKPIGYHHKCSVAREFQERVAVVAAANEIVKGMGGQAEDGVILTPADQAISELIPLTKEQLHEIADRVEPEMEALKSIGPKDMV
jgi:putative nucleotidyltransferase with HDIG domain